MKRFRFSSFRQRLNASLLAASLVPVLLVSALLVQIFRLRMAAEAVAERAVGLVIEPFRVVFRQPRVGAGQSAGHAGAV